MPQHFAPQRRMTVSRSIVIATDPETVYRSVSDPRETSRWSPENTGARVDAPPGPLTIGTLFVGSNRRGPFRWVTRCEVIAADPGRYFGFRVQEFGITEPRLKVPIARWEYRMRAVDGGTELTQYWTDLRAHWPDAAARAFDLVATRGSRFVDFNTRNIETSLAGLKRTLESTGA